MTHNSQKCRTQRKRPRGEGKKKKQDGGQRQRQRDRQTEPEGEWVTKAHQGTGFGRDRQFRGEAQQHYSLTPVSVRASCHSLHRSSKLCASVFFFSNFR